MITSHGPYRYTCYRPWRAADMPIDSILDVHQSSMSFKLASR